MNKFHLITNCFYVRSIIALVLLAGSSATCRAQNGSDSTSIVITYNKTTSLVFAATIKSVDRGSRDILAQKATGIENILHIKAARPYFPETNLTVITEDSVLHQIEVNYAKDPSMLVYRITSKTMNDQAAFETKLTSYQLDRYAQSILPSRQRFLRGFSDKRGKMKLKLHSIHIHDDILFFHLATANRSNISYTIDYARFFVRDRVQAKRTAAQENTIVPLLTRGNTTRTNAMTTEHLIYATDKFTLPRSKRLYIEMYEASGGRNLKLKISNRKIVRARRVQ